MVRSYRDQVTRSANRDVCRLWMGWLGSELALVTAPTEALPLSMCVTHLMIMSYHRRTRPFSTSQRCKALIQYEMNSPYNVLPTDELILSTSSK